MWPTETTHKSGVRRFGVATLAVVTWFMFLAAIRSEPVSAQTGNEHFSVRMAEQEIHGYGWEEAVEVTVEVDDPGTAADPDWTDTKLAEPAEWDPSTGFVQFQPFVDEFVIEPGFIVTMTQLGTTKTHVVTSLEVTDVDQDNDAVSGVGDDGATIIVSVWGDVGNWRQETVSGGTWSADFSVAGPGGDPVDITRGTSGEANHTDNDDDSTQWTWRVPDPAFSVETPSHVWSINDGWVPGRTVTVTVDDDPDPSDDVPLYQTTAPVTSWGPSPWEAGWNINNLGFTIAPGHYVTADDGVEVTKTLLVADLTITAVDETNDVVSGTAVAGAQVEVNACQQFLCGNRSVTADATGAWVADFAAPGAGDHEQDVINIQSGIGGAAQIFDADGDSTHRGWQLQEPYFGVDVIHEEMWAVNWPAGETLTFQVYADDTKADLLWTDTMTVYGTPWLNTEAGYRFWSEFDVAAGQYFTVSDGVTTKDLVVSTLAVTAVDPGADFYTGTVDPTVDADVLAEVCAWARGIDEPDDGLELCDLPDPDSGEWTIDFAGVGDIIPGDHLGAYQRDADGDETSHAWHVPPWIYVELAEQDEVGNDLYPDRVHLEQWTGPVDIYLDGALALAGVATNGEYLQVDLDVEIGQTIRVVDAVDDKSLDIELLTVDNVTAWDDPAQPSTAFGTAAIPDHSRQVQVTATAEYGWWTERWVPVVGGQYQADFANPGNGWRESEIGYFGEGGADDVYLGGEVRAHLWDFDNDQVQAIWHTCNPRIIVVRGNDRIEAVCFPVGSELVLELDDPANGAGIDWSSGAPVIVTRNPDKPWETLVVFELGDYTAPDNAVVTATASQEGVPVVEVTTEVIPFTIDVIDEDTETITGTAPAGSEVLVKADDNWRYPVADGTNTWIADFSQPGERPGEENPVDLRPGSQGGATMIDAAGSATTIAWRISNSIFNVDSQQNQLWGHEWLADAAVTVTIGAESWTLPTDGEGNFGQGWDSGAFDLVPGMLVEVTDGESTKSHRITDLAVTSVDPETDMISGTATAGSYVDVWIHDTGINYTVPVHESGIWSVNTTAEHDLVPGSNGNSGQCDPDGDCTFAGWWVPNPTFSVETPHWVWSSNQDWELGDTITLTIDDPGFPGPLTTTVVPNEGDPSHHGWWFDLAGVFELRPGHEVTVTDGDITKTLTVLDLTIDAINGDNDTVSGRLLDGSGDPATGVVVEVHANRQDGDYSYRTATTDTDGYWVADFGAPGEGETSEPFSIEPNTGVSAQVLDQDWDSTHRGDCFECGPVNAAIEIDKQAATQFAGPGDGILAAPGETVTWTYVISNVGDVDVVDLTVNDDAFGAICEVGLLAAGDDVTCTYEEVAEPGDHSNLATATGTAMDASGQTQPVEAEDGSSYHGLDHGYVTDSSLCVIDGFDLVFTPDMKNWPGSYKLAASNPGQFYWNTFVRADAGAAIEMEIPYPFVTQGAMPLHSNSAVDVGDGHCFAPAGDGDAHPAGFALSDFTDTNGDGSVGYGDFYTVAMEATGEFQYLTLHLDHGLKGTKGWSQSDDDAFNEPEINPDLAGIHVLDGTDHGFVSVIDEGDVAHATATNRNEFKNVKGFGGLVSEADEPVSGAALELRAADGSLLETMVTDVHGWYLSEYVHNGKTADYTLILLDDGGAPVAEQGVTVGKSIKFGEADFIL